MKPYHFFSTFRSSLLILFLLAIFGNSSAFAEPTASELNNIGLIHEKLGDLDKAYVFYCRALNTDTDFTPAYAGLGDIYLAREDYRKAVEAYQNFLSRLKQDKNKGDPYMVSQFESKYRARLDKAISKVNLHIEISAAAITHSLAIPASSTVSEGRTLLLSEDGVPIFQPQGQSEGVVEASIRPPAMEGPPKIDININFAFGLADINESSLSQIDEIAKALTSDALKNSKILIQGHTDNVGSDENNMALSIHRSENVKKVLLEKGVLPSQIETMGKGESQPLVPNDTSASRALNRRVSFINLGE